MSFCLQGKRVVITGGARGIGLAIANAFVAQGAHVAVLDLLPMRADDAPLPYFACDVTDESTFASALDGAVARLGGLDVLINNAGVTALGGELASMEAAYFDRVVAVNQRGVMLGLKLGGQRIADGGSIINTASLAAFVHEVGTAAYNASKAAVVSLTKSAAMEFGPRQVRVNAICPGHVRVQRDDLDPEVMESLEQLCETVAPMGRVAELDDLVGVYHFLAAPESRYMTGQALIIDGGFSLGLTPLLYEKLGIGL